jgi:O-antigen ligase
MVAPTTGVSRLSRGIEILSAILLVAALLSIQALIGGTRLLFAFPTYALLAAIALLSLASLRSAKPLPNQLCLWSAVLFFGYIELRAATSPAPYLASFDIYSVWSGLIVYFFTACVFTSAKARISIFACLLAAALAHVLVGVIQFSSGNNFMPISFLQRFDYGRRASGFYICPNHLAGLLEVLGIFGLSMICWGRWPVWAKLIVGYSTAACYAGIILTGSRGGYLSVAGSVLIFAILSISILRAADASLLVRIGGAGLAAAVLALAGGTLLIHKSEDLSERAKNILDDKNMRLDLWRAAIQQWKLDPLLGTGSRTYQFYGRKFRAEEVQRDPIYVHNDYLQLLSDYGIIGAGAFAIFLGLHLRYGWINARRLGPKRIALSQRLASNTMALNAGALGAVGAYLVHSVFDFNLHIPANVLLMSFVFGILANPGISRDNIDPKPMARMVFWRLLLFALGLLLIVRVWQLAGGEYYAERARVALRNYRSLSAIAFALKGIEHEKQNPNLFYYLGRARVLAGDQADSAVRASFYRAALPPYEEARKLAPLDETYALELAFTYDGLGRFREAEWMYDQALALDPNSISAKQYYQAHLERWRTSDITPTKKEQPDLAPKS